MKILQIFNKTPNNRKFNYTPRFYNPEEEERRERIARIEKEVAEAEKIELPERPQDPLAHRARIQGAFRQAREKNGPSPDTSATMLRLGILLILTVGLIMYLQFGKPVLYALALVLIPLYLYSKFRGSKKSSGSQK
jgi:hypothetical protein